AVIYTKSPEEVVQRRDFTINGLLMEPQTQRVLDFVGGQADLRTGVVRAIGDPDRRVRVDKLRLVRARCLPAAVWFFVREGKGGGDLASCPSSADRVRGTIAGRADENPHRRRRAARLRAARSDWPAGGSASRSDGHERRAAAAAVSPRRRRLDPHADDD